MQIAEFRDIDFADVYQDIAMGDVPADRPYTIMNMISSVDGKATAAGRASPLGTRVDHLLMRRIRAACDALLYGVGTLRAENVDPRVPPEMAALRTSKGMRPQPLRVVVSASSNIPLDNLYLSAPGEPAVIFTASTADEANVARLRQRARVFVVGAKDVDLRHAFEILRTDFGVRTMVTEGGPILNYGLFREHLIDELLLTMTPKIVGGQRAKTIVEGHELPASEMVQLGLRSIYRQDEELFLRYSVVRNNQTQP